MPKERKAIVVHYEPGEPGATDELNALLAEDWTVTGIAAMGGAGSEAIPGTHFAALVILEREDKRSVRGFHPAA